MDPTRSLVLVNHKRHINDLPEIILLLILSLLPTKCAIQTSVLSKRWKDLWMKLSALYFENSGFFGTPRALDDKQKFIPFVYRALNSHTHPQLHRFTLNCFGISHSHINNWINSAISKNVKKLYLNLTGINQIDLPLNNFTSLVTLKLSLSSYSWFTVRIVVGFTMLTTLHLDSVTFIDQSSFQNLLSCCLILETLILNECKWISFPEVFISSSTVRKFVLERCCIWNSTIRMSLPNLVSLNFRDSSMDNFFTAADMPFLANLCIDIQLDESSSNSYEKSFCETLTDFLERFSYVRSLTLSPTAFECLFYTPSLLSLLPTFQNLKKLTLKCGTSEKHFLVIGCLLQCSPALEYLAIDLEPWRNYSGYEMYEGEDNQESKKLNLESLLACLKVVKIRCFGYIDEELKFVKLILSNGSNLEKVILTLKFVLPESVTEISRKLLRSPRASAKCILDIKSID